MAQCGAKSKRHGGRCGAQAITGTNVCRWHGGAAKQVKRKAHERATEAKAQQVLGKLAYAPVSDPVSELADLAGQAAAWKELMAARVAELTKPGYAGMTAEQTKAEVVVFERAMDRCGALLTSLAKLGLHERVVQVQEQQVAMMRQALTAALAQSSLTATQQREVVSGVAGQLRLLAGGQS